MSFPKAPIKRFNENVGCAPAPGSYDIKTGDGLKGPVSFEKSQRFRAKKDSHGEGQSETERDEPTSPVRLRKHASLGSTPNLRQKPEKDKEFLRERKKQDALEKEIRGLLKERAEQDKKLQALEEEFRKTELKLVNAMREKTSLSAGIASMERQMADLTKANDLLKTKFSDDNSKRKIDNLCKELMEANNKLDAKNKEIICLQARFEEQIESLQKSLASSKAALESLKEKYSLLEENHKEVAALNERLAEELNQSQAIIEELRGENKNLENYLSNAQEQMQELRLELTSKEQEYERKLETVTSEMAEQTKTCNSLRIELQNVQEEMMKERRLLEEELEGTLDDLDKLQQQEEAAEKMIMQFEQENKQKAEEIAQLKETLKGFRSTTETKIALVEMEKEALERQLEENLKKSESLEKQICELQESLKLKESLENQLCELQEASRKTEERLKQELNDLQESSALTRQQLFYEQETSAKVKAELENQLLELQEISVKSKTTLEGQLCVLQGSKKTLEQQLLEVQETSAKTKQLLEQQLLDYQECATKTREELEQQIDELKTVITETQKALEKKLLELRETTKNICELELQVLELQQELAKTKNDADEKIQELLKRNETMEKEIRQVNKASEIKEQLEGQLLELQESSKKTKENLEKLLQESFAAAARRDEEFEQQNNEITNLRIHISELQQELSRKDYENEETIKWRTLYEELFNKVRPFQQQLDAFEAEKNALLNEHGAAKDELNKLSEEYAKLLGHQNQKQKIKHVVKLKNENLLLKQELAKVKSELSKVKQNEKQLQVQLNDLKGTKSFDQTKAFQHNIKRNVQPRAPLKDGNRNLS